LAVFNEKSHPEGGFLVIRLGLYFKIQNAYFQ